MTLWAPMSDDQQLVHQTAVECQVNFTTETRPITRSPGASQTVYSGRMISYITVPEWQLWDAAPFDMQLHLVADKIRKGEL